MEFTSYWTNILPGNYQRRSMNAYKSVKAMELSLETGENADITALLDVSNH